MNIYRIPLTEQEISSIVAELNCATEVWLERGSESRARYSSRLAKRISKRAIAEKKGMPYSDADVIESQR